MNTFSRISRHAALVAAVIMLTAAATRASDNPGMIQTRAKAALNEMVQQVKRAETPEAKRSVLNGFLARAGDRAALVEELPFIGEERRHAAGSMREKFAGYTAALQGTGTAGTGGAVADKDLDAFASFVQQDLEQAAVSGGIYLSTGAIIIILLILILIT